MSFAACLIVIGSASAGAKSPSARGGGCYSVVESARGGLRFHALAGGSDGLASLSGRAGRARMFGQSGACSAAVVPGRRYRATLRYRATVAVGLEVLSHSKRGWKLAYEAAKLPRAGRTRSASVTLRTIPAGVDRLALVVVLRGKGTAHAGAFKLETVVLHEKPVTKTTATPPTTTTEAPAGAPGAFPIGPGSWTVMTPPFDVHAVHAILLQNGKVLVMAGSGNSRSEFEEGHFKTYVYDPVANTWKYIPTATDVFCAGHVQLANGNVLIIGGTKAYPEPTKPGELPKTEYKGKNASWIFNIRTETYEEVPWDKEHPKNPVEFGPLLNGAWYPSATESATAT